MTTVALVPIINATGETSYRAVAGEVRSTGKTAGQALDALTAQLGEMSFTALLVIQSFRPDAFFNEAQQKRLSVLMELWRDMRDRGESLPPEQQTELSALVEAELKAAGERSAAFGRTAALMQQTNQ